MKSRFQIVGPFIFLSAIMLVTCGEKKTPSRDYIPLIKESLSRLQEGVRNQNAGAIDSLLSVDILKYQQSSDSLLNFVYGPARLFTFESFGQPVIIYTDEVAKVECYAMDSTHQTNRPIVLTFIHSSDQWLLSRFEIDLAARDSI